MIIGNASTSVTTSESELRSEAIILMMMMRVVFDHLVDYLLLCFSFELVDCILISEHHGIFSFKLVDCI